MFKKETYAGNCEHKRPDGNGKNYHEPLEIFPSYLGQVVFPELGYELRV
jgi:hypothetical protein